VRGAGCRVQEGAGCRVQGAWCRVQGAGCRVQGAGFQHGLVMPVSQVVKGALPKGKGRHIRP
jgi:hypothetical protein